MTETMAVRTGRKVQRSALPCNSNTSGYAAALPIRRANGERGAAGRRFERNFVEQFVAAAECRRVCARSDAPTRLRQDFGAAGRAGPLQDQ
jgi:hypothetical protein